MLQSSHMPIPILRLSYDMLKLQNISTQGKMEFTENYLYFSNLLRLLDIYGISMFRR